MEDVTTFSEEPLSMLEAPPETVEFDALVILWTREEPERAGEVLLIPVQEEDQAWTLGRGASGDGERNHLKFYRQRPGRLEPTAPLASPRISRLQLTLTSLPGLGLRVRNVGRCPLFHNGRPVSGSPRNVDPAGEGPRNVDPAGGVLVHVSPNGDVLRNDPSSIELLSRPGDVLELRNELLLLHVRRPGLIPLSEDGGALHSFGLEDRFGLVGESPAVWELRRRIARVARQSAHVLVIGASGTGKELVARAIHHCSASSSRQMVSRNAATFPEGLIDAELFGNMKNYPNPGMPERPGLVGEADGSSLFLDEFAELPHPQQAHLLRVMDEGEYQRLGDSKSRRSAFRLIAASNRSEKVLKHDIRARFKARIRMPDLNARREDIPLLARHILKRQARHDPSIVTRYFRGEEVSGEPRITPALLSALVRFHYQTHVRELEALLLRAMLESPDRYLDLGPELRQEFSEGQEEPDVSLSRPSPCRTGQAGMEKPPLEGGQLGMQKSSMEGGQVQAQHPAQPSPQAPFSQDKPTVRPPLSIPIADPNNPDSGAIPAVATEGPSESSGSRGRDTIPADWLEDLPSDLSYADLHEYCEMLKAHYIKRCFEASDAKLFRAAKQMSCNRDVIRRYLEKLEGKG